MDAGLYSDSLPPWQPPAWVSPGVGVGPLQKAFEAAFTISELVASNKASHEVVRPTPSYEARQGLVHFARVRDLSSGPTRPGEKVTSRFIFQYPGQARCILVDALGPPRAAPSRAMSSSCFLDIGDRVPDPPGPVIAVRYTVTQRGASHERVFQRLLAATSEQRNSLGQSFDSMVQITADSAEEVDITLRWLTQSTPLIDPSCRAAFDASSLAWKGAFHMGFIGVPDAGKERFEEPSDYPCSGPGCMARTTQRCSGCAGACYCSVACQRAHWPTHKRACKGKHKQADSSSRPSVLLTLVNDLPPGMIFSLLPSNGSVGGKLPSVADVESPSAPLNIHGDAVFVVKVQTNDGDVKEYANKVVIYDRARSFTVMKAAPALEAFVRARGVRGGIKAYCEARREGDSLRVYFDEPVVDASRVDF